MSACISDPNATQEAPMCEVSSDCDSGEVCEEGICYGNPPEGDLAAVLVPSSDSNATLVRTDIPSLLISTEGLLGGLEFQSAAHVEGKVTLVCSSITDELGVPCGTDSPIEASIRVEREPAFPGGPRFSKTFMATTSIDESAPAFSLTLPPTHPDPDGKTRNYQITITPLATASGPIGPAQVAAPRVELDFSADVDSQFVEWKLGEPATTKWIAGCLKGGAGGVPSYAKDLPVAAFGADPVTGEMVLLSSRGRTDNSGCYSLRVPTALETIHLRFEPDGDGPAPRIEIVDEPIGGEPLAADACFGGSPSGAVCLFDIRGPNLTNPEEITVPITAQSPEGGSAPVAGATVRLVANLTLPNDTQDPTRNNRASASIDIKTTSSANASPGQLGQATASAPVNLAYEVSVVPAPDSRFAARIAETRRIDAPGVQEPIRLSRRVAVSGKIVSEDGIPLEGATVTASPTVGFRFGQPANVRAVIDSLSAEATTDEDGNFFFWLEGELDLGGTGTGAEVEYDLVIQPRFTDGPPTRKPSVVPGAAGIDLGTIDLPDASYARGVIFDTVGDPVRDAGLQIWRPNSEDPCAAFSLPDGECPTAATRMGVWLSDDDGAVRIVLPNP